MVYGSHVFNHRQLNASFKFRFARDFLIGIDPQHEHFRSAENVYLTKQNAEYRF